MDNMISRSRGTLGVRFLPDDLDSGYCHLNHNTEAVVRLNLDGIWCSLCDKHLAAFTEMLLHPSPPPEDTP